MPQISSNPPDGHAVLMILLTVRLINALTLKTFFQPDEYFQALEPAWNLANESESAWITWEWHQHLRSAFHPALISLAYRVAHTISYLYGDPQLRDGFMLNAPKVLQSVIAALGDYYTWKLAKRVYDQKERAFLALLLTALSPWQWFCSTRTFSNGLENTLTVAALYCWPYQLTSPSLELQNHPGNKSGSSKHVQSERTDFGKPMLRKALFFAATATIIRPTNLLIWATLAAYAALEGQKQSALTSQKSGPKKSPQNNDLSRGLLVLVRESVLCGTAALGLSALVDRLYYKLWTFPPLNFLYFNVVQSLAVFYGNNDWHYYLSQGYPLLLTTALPFVVVGLWRIATKQSSIQSLPQTTQIPLKALAAASVVLPAALSVLSHKEVRFIYPLLGPLNVIAAGPATDFFEPIFSSASAKASPRASTRYTRGLIALFLIVLNLAIAFYTATVHNSGLIALPDYLRNEFTLHHDTATHGTNNPTQNMTVAFLMPCHSVPWRSHLLHPPTLKHPGIQAWALTCEPPLHLTSSALKRDYLDEADIFYADPGRWLRKTMSREPPHRRQPGVYADPSNAQRNKRLVDVDRSADSPRGLDITDLLPSLRTAPGRPPPGPGATAQRRPWPDYLAFFEQLEPTMATVLRGSGYVECWRRFNSHWHDDWRRTGDVVVWCLFPERAKTVTARKSGRSGSTV